MLEFCVNNQIVTRNDEFRVVSDSRNYLRAHFVLSDEWAEDTAVLFGYGRECFCVLLDENGFCTVPHEVIKPPFFTVSLFCGDDMFVTANVATVEVEKSGFTEGKTPQPPSQNIWQQYLSEVYNAVKNGVPYVGENNSWFLYDPFLKKYVDSGVPASGYSPVCGIDYWTDEDKQEIVEDVLASLTDADEIRFPLQEMVSEVTDE